LAQDLGWLKQPPCAAMPIFIANAPSDAEKQPREMPDESLQGAAAVAQQNALRMWEKETPWPWELNTCPSGLDIDYWTSTAGTVVLPRKPNSSDVTTNTGSDQTMGIRDESSLDSQHTQKSQKSLRSAPSVEAQIPPEVANDDMEALFLISFTRCPSEFRLGLVEGPLLRECRQDMAAAGFSCELATGAKIFCEPEYYPAISRAVKDLESTLRPYHVIVTEKFRQLLLQTAKACPRSMKVKVKEDRVIACFGKGRWIPFTLSPDKAAKSGQKIAENATPFSPAPSGLQNPPHFSPSPPLMPSSFALPMPHDPSMAQPAFEKAVLDELQRALALDPFGFDLPAFGAHGGSLDAQASFPSWGHNLGCRPGQF